MAPGVLLARSWCLKTMVMKKDLNDGNVLWKCLLNNVNFLSSSLDSCLRIASFNEGASVVDY